METLSREWKCDFKTGILKKVSCAQVFFSSLKVIIKKCLLEWFVSSISFEGIRYSCGVYKNFVCMSVLKL